MKRRDHINNRFYTAIGAAACALCILAAGCGEAADVSGSSSPDAAVSAASEGSRTADISSRAAPETSPVPGVSSEPGESPAPEESSEPGESSAPEESSEPDPFPIPEPTPMLDGITEEQYARIAALPNNPHGHGWLGAEKQQPYYSQFGAITVEDANLPAVYLTFDEGYENGYTAKILDVLKEKNVRATFFITLAYLNSSPELVQRMIDEGHTVGNHTAFHPSMPKVKLERAYREVKQLHDAVLSRFGYEMKYFRFPMGESSDRTLALVQEMGYTSVFWSFAYMDWDPEKQPEPAASRQKIVSYAKPGTVYLLHAVSKTNAEVLGDVIDDIRASGLAVTTFGAEYIPEPEPGPEPEPEPDPGESSAPEESSEPDESSEPAPEESSEPDESSEPAPEESSEPDESPAE